MLKGRNVSAHLRTEEGGSYLAIKSWAVKTKTEMPRKMCDGFVNRSSCRKYLEVQLWLIKFLK